MECLEQGPLFSAALVESLRYKQEGQLRPIPPWEQHSRYGAFTERNWHGFCKPPARPPCGSTLATKWRTERARRAPVQNIVSTVQEEVLCLSHLRLPSKQEIIPLHSTSSVAGEYYHDAEVAGLAAASVRILSGLQASSAMTARSCLVTRQQWMDRLFAITL